MTKTSVNINLYDFWLRAIISSNNVIIVRKTIKWLIDWLIDELQTNTQSYAVVIIKREIKMRPRVSIWRSSRQHKARAHNLLQSDVPYRKKVRQQVLQTQWNARDADDGIRKIRARIKSVSILGGGVTKLSRLSKLTTTWNQMQEITWKIKQSKVKWAGDPVPHCMQPTTPIPILSILAMHT